MDALSICSRVFGVSFPPGFGGVLGDLAPTFGRELFGTRGSS